MMGRVEYISLYQRAGMVEASTKLYSKRALEAISEIRVGYYASCVKDFEWAKGQ